MRAERTILEVKANLQRACRSHGAGIAHGTIERPAKAGNNARDCAGQRTVAKAGANHARELQRTRGVEATPIGNRDVEGELCLVCRHDRHVRAWDEGHSPHGSILHGAAPHQRVDLSRTAEGEVCRKCQAFVGGSHEPGAKPWNQREGIRTCKDFQEGQGLLGKLDVGDLDR